MSGSGKSALGRFTRLPAGLSPLHPAAWIGTWFGCGLMPIAPGTWGSAGALPFAAAIAWAAGPTLAPWALVVASLAAYGIGIWASERYARSSGIADPGPVVIDEVAGQWLTLAAVPLDPVLYAAGFFLFRAADIVKPFPANWLDRRVKGGLGIMSDDMVAGLYAGIALALLHRWVW